MKDILDSKVGLRMLTALYYKDSYASSLSYELHTTFSHVVKISQFLKKKGLIIKKKEGRKCIISLTEKGKNVAKGLISVQSA